MSRADDPSVPVCREPTFLQRVARRIVGRALPHRARWPPCSPGLHPRCVRGRRKGGGGGSCGGDGGGRSRRAAGVGTLRIGGFCMGQEGSAPFQRRHPRASNRPPVGGGPRLNSSLRPGPAVGGGGCGRRRQWEASAGVVAGVGDDGIPARLP